MEEYTDFPIEFYNEANDDTSFYAEIEDRLRRLAKGHSDIIGASIQMTQLAEGRATPYAFETTLIVYARPTQIVATERSDSLLGSAKGALDAVERQVREKREKMRNY